jgi:hypothetical protein
LGVLLKILGQLPMPFNPHLLLPFHILHLLNHIIGAYNLVPYLFALKGHFLNFAFGRFNLFFGGRYLLLEGFFGRHDCFSFIEAIIFLLHPSQDALVVFDFPLFNLIDLFWLYSDHPLFGVVSELELVELFLNHFVDGE